MEAVGGTAESIPLADGSVDAVFVGEAFHWFDGDSALVEIARVLRPRGVLAIAFNVWDEIRPALPEQARALLRSLSDRFGPPGGPKVQSGAWKSPFAGSAFEELRHEQLAHADPLDRDRFVALFASMSNLARQPDDVRASFAGELRALVPEGERLLLLTCDVYWTRPQPR